MSQPVVFLSIPGLHERHLPAMPRLAARMASGEQVPLTASFPCVTWPVQANMLTGKLPEAHGVVANGFYWRDQQQVEMWTAWNEKILGPASLGYLGPGRRDANDRGLVSDAQQGLRRRLRLHAGPDPQSGRQRGSLWCYTKPTELVRRAARSRWGISRCSISGDRWPISSQRPWIVDSAVLAAQTFRPDFFYIYLPHLDYAAQKVRPRQRARGDCRLGNWTDQLGQLIDGFDAAYAGAADLARRPANT